MMSPWPSRRIKIPIEDVSLDELQRAFLALWKVQCGLQLEGNEGLLIDKALWHCRLVHERERWEGATPSTEPDKEQP